MVAIRKPKSKTQTSLCTVKNALLVLIAISVINVVLRPPTNGGYADTSLNDLWHQYSGDTGGGNLRKPPIHIEKVPEHSVKHAEDLHTDADDHFAKANKEREIEAAKNVHKEPTPVKKTQDESKHTDETPQDDDENKERAPAADDDDKATEKEPEQEKPAQVQVSKGGDKIDPVVEGGLAKHGTGATKLGYVIDLVHERAHPSYREGSISSHNYEQTEKKVASLVNEQSLRSCEYVDDHNRLQHNPHCTDAETPLYAYNSAYFPRTLCGHEIAPGEALLLEEHCDEPAHLLPQDSPPVNGHGMEPIVVQAKPPSETLAENEKETITCDIPCIFEKDMQGTERHIVGTRWKLIVSKANPAVDRAAEVEQTHFRRDVYHSSTSFSSDIPLSYFSFDDYNLRDRPALDWESAANKATYLLDEECGQNRRPKWFGAVDAGFATAAYGSCQHNTDLAEGETLGTLEGRVALSKKNRIHLAYDESLENDHITGIVWESLLSGAVPAILGPRNADQILPPNSAIYASLYNSWDKFAEYLKQVSEDKELWESYHAWRKDEKALSDFERRFNFTRTSPECRTCRWAYAKKYGLGWDHEQQVVKEPLVARSLCLGASSQHVVKPFRESWGDSSPDTGSESCITTASKASIEQKGFKLSRTVIQHDGVVDMQVSDLEKNGLEEDVVLRLEVAVRNSEGAHFPHTHTLVQTIRGPLVSSASVQDEKLKVTVLANWMTEVRSPKQGVIEVVVLHKDEAVAADEVRRIRVITEDVNTLHDKMTEYFPSPYGKMMIKDFVDPIELLFASE